MIKHALLFFAVTLSLISYSQEAKNKVSKTDSTSDIIISEKQLIEIAKKLYEYYDDSNLHIAVPFPQTNVNYATPSKNLDSLSDFDQRLIALQKEKLIKKLKEEEENATLENLNTTTRTTTQETKTITNTELQKDVVASETERYDHAATNTSVDKNETNISKTQPESGISSEKPTSNYPKTQPVAKPTPAQTEEQPTTIINNYETPYSQPSEKIIYQVQNPSNSDKSERTALNQNTTAPTEITDSLYNMLETNNKKLDSITLALSKLDSLNALLASSTKQDSVQKNITAKDTATVPQNITIVNTDTTAPKKPLSVSKHFYKNIYFDNGSFALDQNAKNHLLSLVEILKTEPGATVFIEGYASNVGNKVFNEQLSAKRTNSVKQALMSYGIDPVQIATNFKGIDYNAKDANEARRTEVYLVKRN